tara:strand:+ start:579 stop:860 length:282 start_codon:yes stop_codon:yes gene_type:complete
MKNQSRGNKKNQQERCPKPTICLEHKESRTSDQKPDRANQKEARQRFSNPFGRDVANCGSELREFAWHGVDEKSGNEDPTKDVPNSCRGHEEI